jgi:bifunctional pyridoxal-dependent enzyme with beta-cystathionase and maltose regulon repressor activities
LIGSKEGIMHICMTYLDKRDEVLVPNPGYPTYRSAVLLAGGKCVEYKLSAKNNYEPDFDKLEKKNLKKVKMMFVNYPQMPTGQLPSKELFEKLVAFGKKHNILIVHDNPYSFILNNDPMSILSIDEAKEIYNKSISIYLTYALFTDSEGKNIFLTKEKERIYSEIEKLKDDRFKEITLRIVYFSNDFKNKINKNSPFKFYTDGTYNSIKNEGNIIREVTIDNINEIGQYTDLSKHIEIKN